MKASLSAKALTKYLIVLVFNLFLISIDAHPAPSLGTCHGLQLNTGYNYLYKTTTQLNNNDHLGKEPVGFRFQSHVSLCNLWQNENNFILQVSFESLTDDRTPATEREVLTICISEQF